MIPSRAAARILLGSAVTLTALIGPLGLDWITFRLDDDSVTQFIGGEIVSLAIVAPLLVLSGIWLARSGGMDAAPVATGASLYVVYTYTTAVLGQELSRFEGNVERYFPLFTAVVVGGLMVALDGWRTICADERYTRASPLQRPLAWVFIALGTFFAITWASQIALVYRGDEPAAYDNAPTLFWLIKFLDFGFCIPALVATGIGLRRGSPLARRAAVPLAVFATCLCAAVCSMAIAMQVTQDPSASPALLAVTALVTAGLAILTVSLVRVLLAEENTHIGESAHSRGGGDRP